MKTVARDDDTGLPSIRVGIGKRSQGQCVDMDLPNYEGGSGLQMSAIEARRVGAALVAAAYKLIKRGRR